MEKRLRCYLGAGNGIGDVCEWVLNESKKKLNSNVMSTELDSNMFNVITTALLDYKSKYIPFSSQIKILIDHTWLLIKSSYSGDTR